MINPSKSFFKKFFNNKKYFYNNYLSHTSKVLFSTSSYQGLQQLKIAHSIWKDFLKPGDIVYDATCGNGHDSLYLASLIFNKETKLNDLENNRILLFCTDIQSKAVLSTVKRLTEGAKANQFPIENLSNCLILQHNHSILPSEIKKNSIRLACFNLGYLPGSIPFQKEKEEILKVNNQNNEYHENNEENIETSLCPYRLSEEIKPDIHPTLGKIITKTESTIKALETVCYYGLKSSKDTEIDENNINANKNEKDKRGSLLSIMCYPYHSGGDEEHEAVQNFLKKLIENEPKNWKIYTYLPFPHTNQPILYLVYKI